MCSKKLMGSQLSLPDFIVSCLKYCKHPLVCHCQHLCFHICGICLLLLITKTPPGSKWICMPRLVQIERPIWFHYCTMSVVRLWWSLQVKFSNSITTRCMVWHTWSIGGLGRLRTTHHRQGNKQVAKWLWACVRTEKQHFKTSNTHCNFWHCMVLHRLTDLTFLRQRKLLPTEEWCIVKSAMVTAQLVYCSKQKCLQTLRFN